LTELKQNAAIFSDSPHFFRESRDFAVVLQTQFPIFRKYFQKHGKFAGKGNAPVFVKSLYHFI
jgi:hypothetical protein